MHWIAPTARDANTDTLESRLWDVADQFRANLSLRAGQYSASVLGLMFLRFAIASEALVAISENLSPTRALLLPRLLSCQREAPTAEDAIPA